MDPLTAIEKIENFDTPHDFFNTRGKSKLDDDGVPLSPRKQADMRDYLIEFLSKRLKSGSTMNDILATLSDGQITSFGSDIRYEGQVVRYFESRLAELASISSETITYGDIIDAYDNDGGDTSPLWQKYINNAGWQKNLKIELGNHPVYNSYGIIQSKKKVNIVANFILSYFYPNPNGGVDGRINFTFDASAKIVGKIFRDITQCFNAITQCNIGDSATTSFKTLSNRNDFGFVSNDAGNPNWWRFSSNLFTSGKLNLYYENNGFSKLNNFGFNFVVENANDSREIIKIPFNSTQNCGASVDYLMELIIAYKQDQLKGKGKSKGKGKKGGSSQVGGKTPMPNKSNIIRLTPIYDSTLPVIKNNMEGLLYDTKRGGDHEQVQAAKAINAILGTVDELCSLYARLIGVQCIYHVNETLYLYRTAEILSDAQRVAGEMIQRKFIATQYLEKLKIIQAMLTPDMAPQAIRDMITQIETILDPELGVKFIFDEKSGSTNSDIITTLVMKNHLILLKNRLSFIPSPDPDKQPETGATPDNLAALIEILTSYTGEEALNKTTTDGVELWITTYTTFIGKIKSGLHLTQNQEKILKKDGTVILGLDYSFVESTNPSRFKKKGSCTPLQFDCTLYSDINMTLRKFDMIINSVSGRGRSKNYYKRLQDLGYLKQLETLLSKLAINGVYTDGGSAIINILSPIKFTDTDIETWFSNLEKRLGSLFDDLQKNPTLYGGTPTSNRIKSSKPAAINPDDEQRKRSESSVVKSKTNRNRVLDERRGITPTPEQFIDRSDALRKIAEMAASVLNSITVEQISIMAMAPSPSPNTMINDLQTYYFGTNGNGTNADGTIVDPERFESLQDTINEMKDTWISDFMDIKFNLYQYDPYNFIETIPDYMITYLLTEDFGQPAPTGAMAKGAMDADDESDDESDDDDESGKGAMDDDDESGKGAMDADDESGKGAMDADDESGKGAMDADDESGTGAMDAYDESGKGAMDADEESGTGAMDAYDESGTGAMDAYEGDGISDKGDGIYDEVAVEMVAVDKKNIVNELFPNITQQLDANTAIQRQTLTTSTGSPSSPISGTITSINDFAGKLIQLPVSKEIYILVLFSLIHSVMQLKSTDMTDTTYVPPPFVDYIPQIIRYSFFESKAEWESLTDKIGKIYPEVLYTIGNEDTVRNKISDLLRLSGGGSKTRRKKRPSKKRIMKTKRSNANTKKNKKRNSKKLKKKNRKKRTTRRKK